MSTVFNSPDTRITYANPSLEDRVPPDGTLVQCTPEYQKEIQKIFSLIDLCPYAVVKSFKEEDQKRDFIVLPRSSSYGCVAYSSLPGFYIMERNPFLTQLWDPDVKHDHCFACYTYNGLELSQTDCNRSIIVVGSSSEISVNIGDDEWRMAGHSPEMAFSGGNTFAIRYRGPHRGEIVEFQLQKQGEFFRWTIINDSRTSDFSDVIYMDYKLMALDCATDSMTDAEPDKALVFRGGIDRPHVVSKRIRGRETVWKDLAQEAQIEKIHFAKVLSKTIVCNGLPHVVHSLLPPGHTPGQKHPTIFFVHGGPASSYDGDFSKTGGGAHSWLQYLACLGYVAVGVNYRGNTGFGADYRLGIRGDFGGQHIEDVKELAREMSKEDYVDPTRMHYFGHSFGAYSGAMLLGKHGAFVQQTFKTMTLASGLYDWSKNCFASDAGGYYFGPFDRLTTLNRDIQFNAICGTDRLDAICVTDPRYDQALNSRISPIAQKSFAASVPVLLIHGDEDQQSCFVGSQQLFERFQQEGVRSKLVLLKGVDHSYSSDIEATYSLFRNLTDFIKAFST